MGSRRLGGGNKGQESLRGKWGESEMRDSGKRTFDDHVSLISGDCIRTHGRNREAYGRKKEKKRRIGSGRRRGSRKERTWRGNRPDDQGTRRRLCPKRKDGTRMRNYGPFYSLDCMYESAGHLLECLLLS